MSYYDDIARGYNELHGDEQRNKLKILSNELEVRASDKLLDVGAGTGISKEFFACHWTAIEPSEGLVAESSEQIILGKGEELPFEDSEFDVVICVTALHNFDDPDKGLREMKRVGKDRFGFSLLRSNDMLKEIMIYIKHHFNILKVIEEDKDDILICSPK